jgi:predicted DNA-binding transcriptional regulator
METGMIGVLKWMRLSTKEIDIYSMLSKSPMTIKQLIKATRLSERMLRTHLDNLVSKKFVHREPLLEKHIKYVYYGNPEETIYDILVKKLNEFRENRKSRKRVHKTHGRLA